MKKAYLLLTTSFIIIFITLTIGAYIKFSTSITSQEFQKDLATIRGYWAIYGAKEKNGNFVAPYYSFDGTHLLYEINASRDVNGIFNWEIIERNSTITNNSVYRRSLELKNNDSAQMKSYKLEGN